MSNLTLTPIRIHPVRTLPVKAADFEDEYLNKVYQTKTTKGRIFNFENRGQDRRMYGITFSFPPYQLREDPTDDRFVPQPLDRGVRRLGIDDAVIKAALHNGPWENPNPGNVYFKGIYDVARCEVESFKRQPIHLRVFPTLVCPVDTKNSDILGRKCCNCADFANGICSLHQKAQDGNNEVGKMFPKLASQNNFMTGSKRKEGEESKLRGRNAKRVITRRDGSGNISVTITLDEETQTPFRLPKIEEEKNSNQTSKSSTEATSENLNSLNSSIDGILNNTGVEGNRSRINKVASKCESGPYNDAETSKGDEPTALKTILRSPASERPVDFNSEQEKRVTFASGENLRQFREVSPLLERRTSMKNNKKKAKVKRKRRQANLVEGKRNREVVSKIGSKCKGNAPQGGKDSIDKVVHEEDEFIEKALTETKTAVSEFAPGSEGEEETILMLDPEGNLIERKLASGSKSHVTIAELRWHVQQDYVCEKCSSKKKCDSCVVPKEAGTPQGGNQAYKVKSIVGQTKQMFGENGEKNGNQEPGEDFEDITKEKQDTESGGKFIGNKGDNINNTGPNPFVTKCVAWNETTENDESEKVVSEPDPLPESQEEEDLTELMNAMRECRYIRWPKQYKDLLEKIEEQDRKLF